MNCYGRLACSMCFQLTNAVQGARLTPPTSEQGALTCSGCNQKRSHYLFKIEVLFMQSITTMNEESGLQSLSSAEIEDEIEHEEDEDESLTEGTEGEGDSKSDDLSVAQRARHALTGRGVTLAMLMADGVIKPGPDAMSIDYLGQKFTADLLPDGKIKWREAEKIFSSPSAWAIHCKKIVNPMKKSGCGWASVRYKGRKLDVYKSAWFRKHRPVLASAAGQSFLETDDDCEDFDSESKMPKLDSNDDNKEPDNLLGLGMGVCQITGSPSMHQESLPHNKLGRRNFHHIPNVLVECTSFIKSGKMQPFKLSISTNCLLLLNFHCHLTESEVVGYMAGTWDSAAQQLNVTTAFPCRCNPTSKEEGTKVDEEIYACMDQKGLVLVGWYHSHPKCQADPSLRDVESQMEYQFQLRGTDTSFQPCFGLIVSPFYSRLPGNQSELQAFYVMPPPEQRPLDYGMPMIVEYTIAKDSFIADSVFDEMRNLVSFYKSDMDFLPAKVKRGNISAYYDKLQFALSKFCPNNQADRRILGVLRNI